MKLLITCFKQVSALILLGAIMFAPLSVFASDFLPDDDMELEYEHNDPYANDIRRASSPMYNEVEDDEDGGLIWENDDEDDEDIPYTNDGGEMEED